MNDTAPSAICFGEIKINILITKGIWRNCHVSYVMNFYTEVWSTTLSRITDGQSTSKGTSGDGKGIN
jgi:hypothetical protein